VLDRLVAAVPAGEVAGSPRRLVEVFAGVPDPRGRRGVRHRLAVLLTLATCAVLAGARSYAAIGEWAADSGETTRHALGIVRVPEESTFRRVLTRLDADALDAALGAWAAAVSAPPAGRRRRVAVDGKTLRGSRTGDVPGRHLLAALDHDTGVVLGQVDVDAKTNEIPRRSGGGRRSPARWRGVGVPPGVPMPGGSPVCGRTWSRSRWRRWCWSRRTPTSTRGWAAIRSSSSLACCRRVSGR
jgi:hypothetical protein